MAKSGPQIKELQRRLLRLARLDGRLVAGADGAWLIWPAYVRAPRPLLQALRDGDALNASLLRRCLQLRQGPLPVLARWLAAAQRDLRTLQKDPDALAQTQAAARRFRSLPQPTPGWLSERQQRLTELTAELQRKKAPQAPTPLPASAQPKDRAASSRPAGPFGAARPPSWFLEVVELVRALRGPAEAAALQALFSRSATAGPAQSARRRLSGLLARLGGRPDTRQEDPLLCAFLDSAARDARSLLAPLVDAEPGARRQLGRAQLRRLWRLVRGVILWPATPDDHPPPDLDSAALQRLRHGRQLILELAGPLLAGLPRARDPQHQERLARAVAHYGLVFRLPSDCPAVTAGELDFLEQQLDRAVQLAPYGLTLTQALGLLRLGANAEEMARLARHLAGGVRAELLLQAAQLGYAAELRSFTGETVALAAYCEWIIGLDPLYRRSGRKIELAPSMTTRVPALREPNLALLLHCLVSSGSAAPVDDLELQLAVLDTAVGLCGRVPQRAAALVRLLTTWPAGAGRARCPEFAAWLGDDALLDRYFHLAGLAGEPAELSRTLLRDFARAERLLRERRYLTALPRPAAPQLQRLRTVEQTLATAALPSPAWTRRRLAERVTEMLGRALHRQLDLVLRDVLQQSFGVAPAVLTPAWRDAVRFYLLTERNDELLAALLRFAAAHPGRSPARELAANQRWLQRAAGRFNVAAWLAPRRVELELGGQPCVLALEEDPLEVLRMGIPFGTCLSLTTGSNAAAAVCNALDANKRVLYLRDRHGTIVGRKLLAISTQWGLVGYELYLALEPRLRPQVAAAVLALCEELAGAAGIALVSSGEPERLHDGFWYDDGPQPFALTPEVPTDVAAYCAWFGLPVPTPSTEALASEAAQWLARSAGAVEQALATLRVGQQALSDHEHADWIIDRLGLTRAEQLAGQEPPLRPFILRRLAPEGGPRLLAATTRWERPDAYELRVNLPAVPPGEPLAVALIEAAVRCLDRQAPVDSHDLWHLTFSELEPSLAVTAVSRLLALCDSLQGLWDRALAGDSGCQTCREAGEDAVLRAARRAYCRRPEPPSVIRCLRSRRAGPLAQRVALHLAAAFCLTDGPRPLSALWALRPPPTTRAAAGLRAVQVLGDRRPELVAEPDFLAALLRQAPRHPDLPTPLGAPFEQLGDLLLDPFVRQQLARLAPSLLSGPADLDAYRPGPWELYYHRRHDTPLRQRLARAARELGNRPSPPKLFPLLAELGDVPTLTALAEQLGTGAEGRRARAALSQAAEVAWQVALDGQDADAPLRARAPRSQAEAPRAVPAVVDPELFRRALRTVERTLASGAPGEREYTGALQVLTAAPLYRFEAAELAERLVQARRGAVNDAELALLRWFLQNKTTWDLPELPPQLAVELAQLPPLRPTLAATLANAAEWPRRYRRMEQLAHASGRTLSGLLTPWLVAQLARDADAAVAAITSRDELAQLLEVAFAHLEPPQWLELYRSLSSYTEAAVFLARLRRSPPGADSLACLRRLADATKWHYPDAQARGSWLIALLHELCPVAEPDP